MNRKAIIYFMEVILCIIAMGLIIFYFSGTFENLPQTSQENVKHGLVQSLILTKENITASKLETLKIRFDRVTGSSFHSELFFINNSCYQLISAQLIQNQNCTTSSNSSKTIRSVTGLLDTGEKIRLIYWSKI